MVKTQRSTVAPSAVTSNTDARAVRDHERGATGRGPERTLDSAPWRGEDTLTLNFQGGPHELDPRPDRWRRRRHRHQPR